MHVQSVPRTRESCVCWGRRDVGRQLAELGATHNAFTVVAGGKETAQENPRGGCS